VTTAARLSDGAARLVTALGPALGFMRPGLGREIAVRQAAADRLCAWGGPADGRPLVWLHGASAGELLGAAPALRELAARRPHALLVTYFSPSGRTALPHLGPDFASPAPLDTASHLDRVLGTLRPELLVFAKLDVWPGMVAAADRAGVPTALINAVVRDGSRRSGVVARRLFRPVYASLDGVGAATEIDARRLRRLGVRREALSLTGDAAFDLALARADAALAEDGERERFEAILPPRPPSGARLVAGSTWPRDEMALLDALRGGGMAIRWQPVLAPHRPTESRVRELLGLCRSRGRPAARWSDLVRTAVEGGRAGDVPAHAAVVFDEMGRLAELYTAADAAYVGGGLGSGGLHNVLEPAAAGIPVLFGPRHARGDAAALERAGGGSACPASRLESRLAAWLDPTARRAAGIRARGVVEAGAGAGAAGATLLVSVWERGRPGPPSARGPEGRRSGPAPPA